MMIWQRIALLMIALAAAPAGAHPEYQRAFLDRYTKGVGADKDFRKLARKAKCNVCHQGKEDRTNYNRYGEAFLSRLAEADRLSEEHKKDKEKVAAAIELVAGLSTDPDDPAAPTFGSLIAEGTLPGGPLDEVKKEPAEN
ncbi:hypothetical protein MalM25_06480 [Planctomycetes bacterium MalM25]|nr:hypothetical protein MalM25_06480 [Planctomycetes bacterium MalM25]